MSWSQTLIWDAQRGPNKSIEASLSRLVVDDIPKSKRQRDVYRKRERTNEKRVEKRIFLRARMKQRIYSKKDSRQKQRASFLHIYYYTHWQWATGLADGRLSFRFI